MLQDEDGEYRRAAIDALGAFGPKAAIAAPALAKLIRAGQPPDRRPVLVALGKVGKAAKGTAEAVAAACGDSDSDVRLTAIETLVKLEADPVLLVPVSREALRDSSPAVRQAAARALGKLGSSAADSVPELVDYLMEQDMKGQETALIAGQALVNIGRPAVKPLIQCLKRSVTLHRRRAAEVLGRIGGDSAEAVPNLIRAADDRGRESISITAVEALGSIGPAAKDAVSSIIRGLVEDADETNTIMARAAAKALGGIGPEAKEAIGPLIKALDRRDSEARKHASQSLGRIGAESVPPLIEALRRKSPQGPNVIGDHFHAHCVDALAAVGKPAVPALKEILTDAERRRYALNALAAIGPAAADAVPQLMSLLEDKDPAYRRLVCETFGKIGPKADSAVPALILRLADDNPSVRRASAMALGDIGPAAKDAVPRLLEMWRPDANLDPPKNPTSWSGGESTPGQEAGWAVKKIDQAVARREGIR